VKKILSTILLLASSAIAFSQTFTWSGNHPILDNQSFDLNINVSGLPTTIDNTFGIGKVCVDITHTYDDDIKLSLVSPDGTTVVILQHVGGSGDNFLGTCLGMDGVSFTISEPPYGGIFYPAGNISSINNGQNPNGTWKLIVEDIAAPDEGAITYVGLEFVYNPPQFIPSPAGTPPSGDYVCPTCACPDGSDDCDLLPDMTASAKTIQDSYIETPGFLKISNATPNIGYGPLDVYGIDSCFCGDTRVPCNVMCPDGSYVKHYVKQRIYHKRPGTDTLSYYDRLAGKMTYHPTHTHLHIDNWSNFTLRTATADPDARNWPIVSSAVVKQSYCLTNLASCINAPGVCVDNDGNPVLTTLNNGIGWHNGCGYYQGIYAGKYDVYSVSLNDPIPLDNVCNGDYYIVSITDDDNNFLESDHSNNWVAVPVTLTQQSVAPIITPGGNITICEGEELMLTATTSNNYTWSTGSHDQSIVVTESGTYTVSTDCNGDSYTSQPVYVEVLPVGTAPSISISQTFGSNPTCPGAQLIFTATAIYGGSSPTYQWQVNGTPVGTNSNTFGTSSLQNGDVVTCTLNSSVSCMTGNIVTSNSIVMSVYPPQNPSVSIAVTSGDNPSCSGSPLTFTATVNNGSNEMYQWKLDNVSVGTNDPVYSGGVLSNGQVVRCDVSAVMQCPNIYSVGNGQTTNTTTSNAGAAYPTYYGNGRQQYIIRASELTALGLSAGSITGISFMTGSSVGNPATLNDYTIRIGTTTDNVATTSFQTVPLTTVYGPVNYTPSINSTNFHPFASPYYWDGVSNLVVDICFENRIYGTAAYQTYVNAPGYLCSTYYQADNEAGSGACSKYTGYTSSYRPNMQFTVNPVQQVSSNEITVVVDNDMTFTFTGSGDWSDASNWLNNTRPPSTLPSCGHIIINPAGSQECILSGVQHIAPGGRITVKANKKFKITGDLDIQ